LFGNTDLSTSKTALSLIFTQERLHLLPSWYIQFILPCVAGLAGVDCTVAPIVPGLSTSREPENAEDCL